MVEPTAEMTIAADKAYRLAGGTAAPRYNGLDGMTCALRAALAALNEAGYVVVPREPTEAQIETMGQMLGSGDTYKTNEDWPHARAAYRAAMLSAAQPAPK